MSGQSLLAQKINQIGTDFRFIGIEMTVGDKQVFVSHPRKTEYYSLLAPVMVMVSVGTS